MKATLSNLRQSPQKVRLVADLIRGKSVNEARIALTFLPKKSSPAMLKLLNSAVANARSSDASVDELFVKAVQVNKGQVLKRFAPRARGRAARFSRTSSIVTLELGTKQNAAGGKQKAAKKTARKSTAKKSAKKSVAKES